MKKNSEFGFRNSELRSSFHGLSFAFRNPNSEFRILLCAGLVFLLSIPAFARCPVSSNATVVVHAPIGNLLVDTTGTDAVDVEISNRQVTFREVTCTANLVEIQGSAPAQFNGSADWKIRVPKSVNLDLVTMGGNIN